MARIPPKLLMETAEQTSVPLARVFNLSLKEGVGPFERKEANIILLFKKGSRRCQTGNQFLVEYRGLVDKVSKFEGCEFKTHTGHGSFSKLRQFHLPYFASVYSAANEYKHCLEGTCDGLVSRPGESV